jgi:hypothetical protein
MRARLAELHEQAASRAALIFVASEALAALEREAGRDATLGAAGRRQLPGPRPRRLQAAPSSPCRSGHLGRRTDWALLRGVAERLGDRLVLLLVGELHEDEARGDRDAAACREHPSLVWLGHRSDEEAARLILASDVGIVPFQRDAFNDAALPYRILKYARLGRRTVAPPLSGVDTWARAVTTADGPEAFADALAPTRAPAPGRTSSCARGRSSRPRAARTIRCGSACARSASTRASRPDGASGSAVRARRR